MRYMCVRARIVYGAADGEGRKSNGQRATSAREQPPSPNNEAIRVDKPLSRPAALIILPHYIAVRVTIVRNGHARLFFLYIRERLYFELLFLVYTDDNSFVYREGIWSRLINI